ncbi:MAG: adenylate/guanylate cyclase domain-containing protein [Desulfobacterales bacterium]|nr:adenylate/guanylate cyclase domain-containing protein [Desulfobacterales bacterium]
MISRFARLIKNISLPGIGILISILIGICYVYQPYFVRFLDNKIYDIILRRNHVSAISDMVEIIDIDERSLEEYGQWPWPRYRVALLLQKLREAGARAVGMDILFAEPDNSSPINLKKNLKRDLDVDIGFTELPPPLEDNDVLLADILKQGPFVIGFYFSFGHLKSDNKEHFLKPVPISVLSQTSANAQGATLLKAEGVISPLPLLSKSAPVTGFINTVKDRDGILRTTPVLMEHEGSFYINLGLSTLWAGLQKPSLILKINEGGVESLRFGKTVIPLDRNGRFRLHFRGKRKTFTYNSAADVLNGTVGLEQLRGKLLLVGTSAAGLEDLRTTPFDIYFPGVEAQATLIDNILTGDFIRAPDWVPGLEFIVTILAGLFVVLLISVASNKVVLPATLTLATLCWLGSEWTFANHHFFVSPLFPLINLAITFGILTFTRMYHTERDRAQIRQAFSRYVAPSLVDEIAKHPERLNLEGEEKEVTVLFSDVREFTSMSEKLSPTEVTTLLNHYLTPVTRIIRQSQGTLDKFIGDAVMAFWNAPLDVPDHPERALNAGLDILAELPELNKEFKERFNLEIAVGIGVHSGQVRVGNMGSDDLFDYTILGDNVNLTSRLESLTKFYGVDILVSENIKLVRVDDFEFQEVDTVRVKGKETPVTLYTCRRSELFDQKEQQSWLEGLALYKEGSFSEAIAIFNYLRKEWPTTALYQLYLERCRSYLDDPPERWDGIYSHLSK